MHTASKENWTSGILRTASFNCWWGHFLSLRSHLLTTWNKNIIYHIFWLWKIQTVVDKNIMWSTKKEEKMRMRIWNTARMFLLTILAAGPIETCRTVTKLGGSFPTLAPIEANSIATHRCMCTDVDRQEGKRGETEQMRVSEVGTPGCFHNMSSSLFFFSLWFWLWRSWSLHWKYAILQISAFL